MPPAPKKNAAEDKPERIAKLLARAGLCSRREAERWIADGRVAVDGQVLDSPAVAVTPAARITVDGKPLPAPERTRLWRYHKRSEEHTSELQSLMRISYAVFCLKKKTQTYYYNTNKQPTNIHQPENHSTKEQHTTTQHP